MYTIIDFLAPYPDELRSSDIADVLGCTVRTAVAICNHRHLVASKSGGQWMIAKDDLLEQLLAVRRPPLPR
jgi:hypothetical protein